VEARHHAEMEKLYRQHVLKEEVVVASPVIQIQGLGSKKEAPAAVN
jgi:hypothetical protein